MTGKWKINLISFLPPVKTSMMMIFTALSEGHLNLVAKIFEIDLIAHFLLMHLEMLQRSNLYGDRYG